MTNLDSHIPRMRNAVILIGLAVVNATVGGQRPPARFHLQEATIDGIQYAIRSGQITTAGLVGLYLERINAYNGACVGEPQGILGPVTTKPRVGQINALSTLDLRAAARKKWGFDE